MTRRRVVLWALSAAATAFVAAPNAHAQSFSETRRGDGTLERRRGGADTLREASVSLRSNGEVSLVFQGQRSRHSFGGKWTRGRSNLINIRVEGDFGGARATGTGEIYLRGNDRGFERITLNGTESGGRFYIRFEAGDSGRPWDGGRPNIPGDLSGGGGGRGDYNGDLRATQNGSGSLRSSDRRTESLSRVRVEIDGNSVRLVAYGRSTQTFGGRVTGRDGENIKVRLDGDIDGDKTTLEGYINIRRTRNGFDRIRLKSTRGRNTSLDFDAR
jgi:hypothetical protein